MHFQHTIRRHLNSKRQNVKPVAHAVNKSTSPWFPTWKSAVERDRWANLHTNITLQIALNITQVNFFGIKTDHLHLPLHTHMQKKKCIQFPYSPHISDDFSFYQLSTIEVKRRSARHIYASQRCLCWISPFDAICDSHSSSLRRQRRELIKIKTRRHRL